jgi:hypothetical protein
MRINSRKIRKIFGRVWQHINAFLKPFALRKLLDASAWMQHSRLFIWFGKPNKGFFHTIFPVKKINVGEVLKLWENCYLIVHSIHILNFEISGCDKSTPLKRNPVPRFKERRNKEKGDKQEYCHWGRYAIFHCSSPCVGSSIFILLIQWSLHQRDLDEIKASTRWERK